MYIESIPAIHETCLNEWTLNSPANPLTLESMARATPVLRKMPLFARKAREDVDVLLVRRFDGGAWVKVPEKFRPDDLRDREAVRARFGGGRYEVIGQNAQTGRIAARTRFVLDGDPLPIEVRSPATPNPGGGRVHARSFATAAGALTAIVWGLLDQGKTIGEIVAATHVEPKVLRGLYVEWLTPFGEELPQTREEIERLERENAARLLAEWDRVLDTQPVAESA
jgi:hypothetical protein